jgi:TonB family protein
MRLVLITLTLFVSVSAVSAQRLEGCEGFSSKYRDLGGQALAKVAAHYPGEPGMRAKGRVTVLIKVDRRGRVISAHVLCGHPLLVASSVAAARSWKFQPTRSRTRRVGIISFDFAPTDAFSRTGGA